jgi:hypothetical protein
MQGREVRFPASTKCTASRKRDCFPVMQSVSFVWNHIISRDGTRHLKVECITKGHVRLDLLRAPSGSDESDTTRGLATCRGLRLENVRRLTKSGRRVPEPRLRTWREG